MQEKPKKVFRVQTVGLPSFCTTATGGLAQWNCRYQPLLRALLG